MTRISVFGDSIDYGYCADDGWADLLRREMMKRDLAGQRPTHEVVNHSVRGALLHHYMDSGLVTAAVTCNSRKKRLGVFCLGMNEPSILRSQGQTTPRRSPEELQTDLEALSILATQLDLPTVFLGSNPVDPDRASDFRGDKFTNEGSEAYESIVAAHAQEVGATHVSLRQTFDTETMLSADGLHPNALGHRHIYETIRPVIGDLIGHALT